MTLACRSPTASGDEQQAGDANGAHADTIELSDLPAPPEKLAKLIERGDVVFLVGERTPDAANRYTSIRPQAKLGGETHFQLGFDYRCRSRWRIQESDGRRLLKITVNYQQIKLNRSHQIWLRKRPESSGFWNSGLVLHEFDHVRLSSDATVDKRFVEKLRQQKTVTEEIGSHVKVTDSYVQSVVDRQANKVFDETIQLINIRYKELDRQTDHGLRPLPEDSSLAEWLH